MLWDRALNDSPDFINYYSYPSHGTPANLIMLVVIKHRTKMTKMQGILRKIITLEKEN